MTVSRRTVLSWAIAIGLPEPLLISEVACAQGAPVRVRENIKTFVQNPQKIAALRAGIGRMKARSSADRDDPLGWYYWTAVHGTTDDPGALGSVYNQCEHTRFKQVPFEPYAVAEHFISWHRPFLFYFEATLKRAAQEAGVTTAFELPYWNWYADGDLPMIFTEGTEASNPLLHPRRRNSVNSAALDRTLFVQKALLPLSIPGWRDSFAVPMELDPHGAVHNLIGKDMGNIRLSARDPIFWLHHANIDRLWTAWTKTAGGKNPAPTSAWARATFTYDASGQMRQTAGAIIDSEKDLNYRYDDETLPPSAAVPVAFTMLKVQGLPKPEASVARIATDGPKPTTGSLVSAASSLSLGNHSVAVDMQLPHAAQTQLQTFANSIKPSGSAELTGAWLVLENVEIGPDGQDGGFSFNIIATLPDAAPNRKVKLGQLGTFTWPDAGPGHGAHEHSLKPVTLTIPLKDVLNDLGVKGNQDLAKGLRVSFEAVHPDEPGAPNPQFVKIGSISIKTTTAPLQ